LILAVFILGLVIGSFLNVCIYRIPEGKSIVSPPSSCPSCGSRIRWYDNIPVLSYLMLRGRCRSCGERISIQYPLVELTTAVLSVLLFLRFGVSIDMLYFLVLTCSLIVISVIDIRLKLIPVRLCYFCMLFGMALSPLSSTGFINSVLGASFGAGIVLFIIETYYVVRNVEGMGYGDANVLALIGAFLGWRKILLVLFIASLVGTAFGLTYMLLSRKGLKASIPFGPFLSAGAFITIILGDRIISWYLGG